LDLSLDIAIAMVAIVPFLAALAAPFIHRAAGAATGWILAIVPASIFLFLLGFIEPVAERRFVAAAIDWVPSYGLNLSFFVDGLALVFALAISGIGTFILIYSGSYLKGHPHQGRFLAFITAFMGAMLGLVLADNMLALFLFWELTSVTSFLLIGFDHRREKARRAAIQAIIVTGAGGLALLFAAILLNRLFGVWDLSAMIGSGLDVRGHGAYGLVLVLVLLAAFTKSAQFPFHFWLPNAMEAPTPVSAFLHSATMVQGGVYLLARTTPLLGGTEIWTTILVVFGGFTLIWGALAAIRQTDMKQMLAQTTLASLGLLVLLIGVGSEAALLGMVVYFIAHALYKAGLFLVVGNIDHGTGSKDITALGGLRDPMTASFIAALMAGISMVGLPPFIGYLAKEEMYLALAYGDAASLLTLAVLVVGNALLAAVGLAIMIKPFMGSLRETPHHAHEGSIGMLTGPVLFGATGILAGFATPWLGEMLVAPAASAIANTPYESHLKLVVDPRSVLFWLSMLTWGLGALAYWWLAPLRTGLRRLEAGIGWTFDKGFDSLMFGLIGLAAGITRLWHHGRLELYLVVVFLAVATALLAPMLALGGLPALPAMPDLTFYEWAIIGIAAAGLITVVVARRRLFAILALGIQGLAVALLFMLFGAPDLAFTQFMVEILSVVILTLVMTRLRLDHEDPRPLEDFLRDGVIALLCGVGFTLLMLRVIELPFDATLSEFFAAYSAPIAHGHNIVNVILVDFRGLDTLGEISVVMAAGIAILALIRSQKRPAPPENPANAAPRRDPEAPR
jgi:multicomponent Na+:H+ antiporter subunit A